MTDAAGPLDAAVLPHGVRARFVATQTGLVMHVLEAGFEDRGRPCLLLLHGFPELAYSWRKVMLPLAAAGFHVVAPDQRGYGRTTGWDGAYDGDLGAFTLRAIAGDAMALVRALGYDRAAVVGHDFGAPVAACCALAWPEMVRTVVMMSAPFAGTPSHEDGAAQSKAASPVLAIDDALARLARPRKHYQAYYSTRAADDDMLHCKQGLHAFLRAYYHVKSADWPDNQPFPLRSWTADQLALMPTYYVMDRHEDMAETVAHQMPSASQIAGCRWLPDHELSVYSREFGRTGFQGALQWYRCGTNGMSAAGLRSLSRRTIDMPSWFIAGRSDWGIYQVPGSFETMRTQACTRMLGTTLIEGAGHWVQQEQPERVSEVLIRFLQD